MERQTSSGLRVLKNVGLAGHLWRAFSILRCPPFELKRADEVERRMAADGIVEAVDVTADCARGFDPALEDGAADEFGLEGLEERWTCRAFVESVFDFTLPALRTEAG